MATAMLEKDKNKAENGATPAVQLPRTANSDKASSSKQKATKQPSETAVKQTTTASIAQPTNFNVEAWKILREMNSNINKTNASIDVLSKRVDALYEEEELYGEEYQDEGYDPHVPYDDAGSDYENVPPSGSDETVFGRYAKKFKKTDVTDAPVNETLASLVNEAFREGMADESYSEVVKTITRPDNCDSLKETKVNPGVWSVLRTQTQIEDSKMRGIQNCVVKATSNLVKILESNSEAMGDSGIEMGMNAIGLLGQANKWINTRRKENHKKDMDPKLHHLCSSTTFSDWLYGDTIIKDIKDIEELNKISKNVQGARGFRPRGTRGGRFNRGSSRFRPYYRRGRFGPQNNSQILAKSKNSQKPEVSAQKK